VLGRGEVVRRSLENTNRTIGHRLRSPPNA
jgi:hypothetical protein